MIYIDMSKMLLKINATVNMLNVVKRYFIEQKMTER